MHSLLEYSENISSVFLLSIIIYTITITIKYGKKIGIYSIFSLLGILSLLQILFAKYLATKPINEGIESANSLNITIYILIEFSIFIIFLALC